MKRVICFICMFALLSTACYAVSSSRATNLPVMDNNKGLYGKTTGGAAKHLVGVSGSDKVLIDSDAVGTQFGGSVTLPKFLNNILVSVNTTATGDCKITLTGSYCVLDTWHSYTSSVVNRIVTAGVTEGTIITFRTTDSGRDVTFKEDSTSGNIVLGAATRALSDTYDVLRLMKRGTQYVEVGFFDNN